MFPDIKITCKQVQNWDTLSSQIFKEILIKILKSSLEILKSMLTPKDFEISYAVFSCCGPLEGSHSATPAINLIQIQSLPGICHSMFSTNLILWKTTYLQIVRITYRNLFQWTQLLKHLVTSWLISNLWKDFHDYNNYIHVKLTSCNCVLIQMCICYTI